jgi:hypothetical protein
VEELSYLASTNSRQVGCPCQVCGRYAPQGREQPLDRTRRPAEWPQSIALHCGSFLGWARWGRRLDLHADSGAPGRACSRSVRESYCRSSRLGLSLAQRSSGFQSSMAHRAYAVYERRPPAESAAIRNAAAMNDRLSFGITAFFLNRWIFAVSVSLSRATLM